MPLPPDDELTYRVSRSGGAGGQHVNKTATRVEVLWDLGTSESVSEADRARLQERLAGRISSSGVVRVVCDTERSQLRNKSLAAERLRALVAAALVRTKRRKRKQVSRVAKAKRVDAKRQRGSVKALRRPPRTD